MPAGVSWGRYLGTISSCSLAMIAGSQTINYIYKPLDDFNAEVQRIKQEIRAERAKAAAQQELADKS